MKGGVNRLFLEVFMNKTEFDNWLEEIRSYGIKPGLSRVKELLRRLENPQNKLQIIHITGTNGKGTTATVLKNVLKSGGYDVGQFSTPSIISFNHMFDVNGPISDRKLFELSAQIKELCEDMIEDGLEYPTEYEIIAAIMYQYFYECHVDFAVVEVAMGGENDCTNVMDHSILSIITPISLDHTGFLGHTLLDIAKEKSGVVKHNSTLVLHPQDAAVEAFLVEDADNKMTVIKRFDPILDCKYSELMSFEYKGLNIETSLMGTHQALNIIGVIEAIDYLNQKGYVAIGKEGLLKAVKETTFEGRFERIDDWILDGAHNHESLMALKKVLDKLGLNNLIGLFGALKDKDFDEALKSLKPYFCKMIVTEPVSFRKLDADSMAERLKKLGYDDILVEPDITKAYEIARQSEGYKLGFGSFYMIADLRKEILKVH